MFSKLGLQLYTVRDLLKADEKSMEETIERLVAMGYTEGQTAGLESETYARIAKKYGMSFVGTHYNYEKILNDIDDTMRLHDILETKNIGVGAMPAPGRTNQEGLDEFIESYNKAAEIYAKHGFKLTYHNHSFEFASHDGKKTLMDYMIERFHENISFVLDTCWVANVGMDVCDMMKRLEGRIDILHLKDIKTVMIDTWATKSIMCEVGNGFINWDKVLKTAEEIGVKHYVVEQDNFWIDDDPLKSLEVSKNYLQKYIK